MKSHVVAVVLVLTFSALAGCYVDYNTPATIDFHGEPQYNQSEFVMRGEITVTSGERSLNEYRNLTVILYTAESQQISRHPVGTIRNRTDRLSVNIVSSQIPKYVIITGSNLWQGDEDVVYYTRNPPSTGGYTQESTSKRCELPVTNPCS